MTTRTQTARPQAAATTAWVILAVLLLFSIAAPLNQFKAPPIMPILMASLGLSVSRAGLLMSVYAVTGLVLALPSGFILQRVGFKWTGVLAGGSIVLGAVLGAVSGSNTALLLSRVVEGAGTGFMAVLAPALIAQWFAEAKRGTAMGIWSAWVPVGTAATLLIAPPLAQAGGWRAVWWLGAIYAAAATVVYLLVVRAAPAARHSAPPPTGKPTVPAGTAAAASGAVIRNRNIWLLAAAFAAYCAAIIGASTYLPTFLSTVRGIPLGQASLLAAVPTLITIFSAPLGGVLSDRLGSRKKPYLFGLTCGMLLMPLTGFLTGPALAAVLVACGLAFGMAPTAIFSAAVEAAGDPHAGGHAMAVIMVGQNAGMLLGPLVFGALAQSVGWPVAFASVAVIGVLGVIAGALARVR